MKIFSWVLCLSMLAIAPLVKAQSPSPDFCQKYPFNARCKQNTPLRERPFPRNNLDRSKIIDNLTIEVVEKYLRKIGYVDISRLEDINSIVLMMQGQSSFISVAPNGKGMTLLSYFPKDEKVTLEAINNWNKGLRYSMAYILELKNKEEMAILATNLTVTGGVSEKRIESFFQLHNVYINRFNKYLNEQ